MADCVTLEQVREFLKFNDTYTDDDTLISTVLIPAANDVVRRYCGDIIPKTFDEYYDGGDYSIWTRHTPILSVTLCEEGWGFVDYSLTEIQVNSSSMPTLFAFSIDLPLSGKISRRSGGNVSIPFIRGVGNVHVIYQTGFEDIPGSVTLAALELIQIWFRAMLQDQAAADPYAVVEGEYQLERGQGGGTLRYFGVPDYIIAMLQANARDPIIG
jgi:hypothetical protein